MVGLVGGSGTGKSTIAAHLVDRGAGHIDADRVAYDVLAGDIEVQTRIGERFGDDVLSCGKIDRKALAERVFMDGDALEALNAIIHPPIIDACVRRLESLAKAGADLVVIDAALLLEVPLPFTIDLMIALRCGREERIRRLMKKGDRSQREIEARLGSQTHLEKSFCRADAVVDTGKPKSAVLKEIDRLVDPLWNEKAS